MSLRALVLLLVTLPVFGADVPLGNVSYQGTCEAYRSRAASNGTTFYGAWTFVHVGFAFISGAVGGGAIGTDGDLLTPTEHRVADGPATTAIASNGNGYLVVYDYAGALIARFADAQGIPYGSPIIVVNPGIGSSYQSPVPTSVAASWNGTHYVVAGTTAVRNADNSVHASLFAATIDLSGHVLSTRTIADETSALDAAPAGDGHTLLLIAMNETIATMRLDDTLATTPAVNLATATKFTGKVAPNGSGFLAVWEANGVVNAMTLDANGAPAGSPFAIGAGTVPAVTWDGSSDVIVWQAGGDVLGARTNGSGATTPFRITSGANPSVASNTNGDTIVLTGGGCGAISSRVVRRGALAPEPDSHLVSREASSQTNSRAVRTSSGTQVLWYDGAVHLSLVNPAGLVSVRQLTESSSASGTSDLIPTASGTAAAWEDHSEASTGVRLQRFDASGAPISAPVKLGTTLAFDVRAAAIGDDVAVAFTQNRPNYPSGYDFVVAVVAADGSIHQTGPPSSSGGLAFNSTITAIGDRYLAVWRENDSTGTPLFSALLDRNANVLSTQRIADDGHVPFGTALGTNGSSALLAWRGIESTGVVLLAQRLDASGAAVGAPMHIATSDDDIWQIRVTPQGADYAVTYITLEPGTHSTVLRQIIVRSDSTLTGATLATIATPNAIDEYTLDGSTVTSFVLRRSTQDALTNGVARLFWTPMLAPRVRAVRER